MIKEKELVKVKWFKSLGLDKDNVYFWINEFKFSRNLENTKQALNALTLMY